MSEEENNEISPETVEKNVLPTDEQPDKVSLLVGYQHKAMFSGPIPPPEILKAYDLVEPGFAKELIEMSKRQALHRMEMEKIVISGDSKRSWCGLIFAFIITLFSIGIGAYLIRKGHDLAGSAVAGTPVVSIVTAFIYGSSKRSQERAEKRKALLEIDKDEEQ